MVCSFGLSPEATEWLGATGAHLLGGGGAKRSVDFASWAAGVSGPRTRSGSTRKFGADASSFDDAKKEEPPKATEGEEQQGMGCFPGGASVYAKGRGPVPVSELHPGDLLLCGDSSHGQLCFSPFVGHLHLEVSTPATYMSVKAGAADGAPLLLSPEHLVFAASSESDPLAAVPASTISAGQWISRVNPLDMSLYRVRVANVSQVSDKGYYAPLTQCGTIVVEGVLCSCYADAMPASLPSWLRRVTSSHEAMHRAVTPLRLASQFVGLGAKDAAVREGIHPYCRALMALPMAIA